MSLLIAITGIIFRSIIYLVYIVSSDILISCIL
nr:MAG TPA: hypothetical protein [Bacteriophage sp.]